MSRAPLCLAWLVGGLLAVSGVMAQEAPAPRPAPSGAASAPADAAAENADAGEPDEQASDSKLPTSAEADAAPASLDDYAPAPRPAPTPSEVSVPSDAPEAEQAPAAPPLGPPQWDEQSPPPVPREPPHRMSRRVILGIYAGAAHRTAEGEGVDYKVSAALGPFAAVDVLHWLRAIAYARFESIAVDVKPGAFDTERTEYGDAKPQQKALDSIGLGFRVLPSLAVLDQVKLLALVDVAWNRFTAPAPVMRGEAQVRSAERAGVALNYKAGVGVSVEPVRHWLELSLTGAYGIFTSQNGSAFDVLQGFDQNGQIVHLAPLPRFQRSLELLLTLGVIL